MAGGDSMKALVVDDEPFARRRLRRLLEALGDVEVIGEAVDGRDALRKIKALGPEVVFLDIRMPGLDGLSLAASGEDLPPIVFTTAYHEYAVQAFDSEAVDYLLKPIEPERLRKAVERVRSHQRTDDLAHRLENVLKRIASTAAPPRIAARTGSTAYVFDPREIIRFRAESKYVVFRHHGKSYVLDDTISVLEQRLAPLGFLRPHRSELVNGRHVLALHAEGRTATLELTDGARIAVSRRRLAGVRQALGISEV
jgi:two-component system LytT family response regulator